MSSPAFLRISSLKGVGVFRDVPPNSQPYDFQKYNLIYGFNGSGKTTLSRVFDSVAREEISPNLDGGSSFTFACEGDHVATFKDAEMSTTLAGAVAVFNEDFIDRAFAWKSSSAKPIAYIGEKQAEAGEQADKLEAELPSIESVGAAQLERHSTARKAFEKFKTNTARAIAEELLLGRGFTARTLSKQYEEREFDPSSRLTDELRRDKVKLVAKKEASEKFANLPSIPQANGVASDVARVLQKTVQKIAIEQLERRPEAAPWVSRGLDFHEPGEDCSFCGNEFTAARKYKLEAALSGGFKALEIEIGDVIQKLRDYQLGIDRVVSSIPTVFSGVSLELQESFEKTIAEAQVARKAILAEVSKLGSAVSEKAAQAGEAIEIDLRPIISADAKFSNAMQAVSQLISRHNKEVDDFEAIKSQCRNELLDHFLYRSQEEYRELEALALQAEKDAEKASDELQKAKALLSTKRAELIEHGGAAEVINKLLHSYLGHKRISVKTSPEGYEIFRDGKLAVKPLSEGEKTAISFCYFLIELKAENRKIEDLVVVVDDPISSLDTRALAYVVALMRTELKNARQLFVLTHNIEFMKEVKKWLNRFYRNKDNRDAELFFIESEKNFEGDRYSKVTKLPKLIRDYESEYHYLYSLIDGFVNNPEGYENFEYLMPNAIRKVLETFLAFKFPGPEGLDSKVDQLLRQNPEFDAPRMRSMVRVSTLESHADNIGDATTFSQLTLETTREGAAMLLECIEALDEGHKIKMDRLCR